MARCYQLICDNQNAIHIIRVLGNSTLFLTFTANPHWPEILRNLEHSQTPDARLDLIVIVFKLKLDSYLHDLKKRHIFGRCIGNTYSIEYQKRGLPRAHILLFLPEDFVPRNPDQVDI
ncbi:hypothetical protein EPUL_002701, partial [Erysiphe pulchra]